MASTSGASDNNNTKRHFAMAAMFVPVTVLALCLAPFRFNPNRFFHGHGIRNPPSAVSSSSQQQLLLAQYVRRICRVQFQGWTTEQQKTQITLESGTSTLRWCKTLDGNVSFAAGRGHHGWIEKIAHDFESSKRGDGDGGLLMLVENPLVRVARFYRDALTSGPEGPFQSLAVDIKAHHQDRDGSSFAKVPSFAQFLSFVIDLGATDGHPLGYYWAPYSTICQPCLLRYDAVVKMDEVKEGKPVYQAEVDGLVTFYGEQNGMDEALLERIIDYYRDDLMLLNYSVDRFYQELYKGFQSVIVQVRPF